MNRGFSLLELLLVLAILSLLMVGGSMITTSVYQSSILTRDADMLANEMAKASLDAVKLNRPVQFRFYRFKKPIVSSSALVHSYQTLTLDIESGKYVQHGKPVFFSSGVAVNENRNASTILRMPQRTPKTGGDQGALDPEIVIEKPYTYYEFEFRPDGSTNLPKDTNWGVVLAIVDENNLGQVPKNFRAISLDPFTGAVKKY